jgi:hypothetical protein
VEMLAFVAPVILVLGAGLFAAGALSFLDIHFFEKRLAERAALAGGLSLIVLAELIFASSDMSMRFLNGQRSDGLCRKLFVAEAWRIIAGDGSSGTVR